jgi:hypothetical protein
MFDDDSADVVLRDVISHSTHAPYPGDRYTPETREFAFELLRTCGATALTMVRKHIPLPSRQSLCRKPPERYERSDLTDFDLVIDRVRKWRSGIAGKLSTSTTCPRCILACDALGFKPSVEVTPDGVTGLDVNDFDFNYDLLESLTSSAESFREFVEGNWDKVIESAFVFQIQPLNPNLSPFVVYAQPKVDGKARHEQVELLKSLKVLCGQQRITIGAFATDGDARYDVVHNQQSEHNLREFEKTFDTPCTRKYRAISDVMHMLKRARYRMLKTPPMAIGLNISDPTLELPALKMLFLGVLPPVVFCDDPITKMHDSLPMLLFRFETLIKVYEAGQLGWLAYFLPWVLINEAMSCKSASTVERLGWFRVAYCYLMNCLVTYRDRPLGPGMLQVGRASAGLSARRTLFDPKLLRYMQRIRLQGSFSPFIRRGC